MDIIKKMFKKTIYLNLSIGVLLSSQLNCSCSKKIDKEPIKDLETIIDYRDFKSKIKLPFIKPSNEEETYVFENNDLVTYMNWMRGKNNSELVEVFSDLIHHQTKENFYRFENMVLNDPSLKDYFPIKKILEYDNQFNGFYQMGPNKEEIEIITTSYENINLKDSKTLNQERVHEKDRLKINSIIMAFKFFKLDNRRFPNSFEEMVPRYLTKTYVDRWDNSFEFKEQNGVLKVYSNGLDKIKDTKDDALFWEIRK